MLAAMQPFRTPRAQRSRADRRLALSRGARAEWIALLALMLRGWRPVARRYRAPGGEIDLVVRRGDVVAFVEVKARAHLDDAELAITAEKRRRIARAVNHWLVRNPWAQAGWSLRLDAVFVGRGRWPRHVEGAWEMGA